jgi:predicted RNA-binding protein with PIN domain
MRIDEVHHEQVFEVKNRRSICLADQLATVGPVSGEHPADVPDQALRSALEFAVGIAAAGAKLRPPLSFPVELRRFLRFHKLPPTALSQVRGAVEGDDDFRTRLASVATEELVDPVGMLWLSRPDGWAEMIVDVLPEVVDDHETAIRRADRRRQAAEESATRARAELLYLGRELERERAATAAVAADADRLRAELDDLRQRLREAQRAEHETTQALAKIEAELIAARRTIEVPSPPTPPLPAVDPAVVHGLLDSAVTASTELARLINAAIAEVAPAEVRPAEHVGPVRHSRPVRRVPIRLPGGVLSGSVESAEYLLRTAGALALIDGYNVAKLGWPALELDEQREQCITAAENLAKRWNMTLSIVFDGATIEGAHASARRQVRVVYSPEGVSADDVLRAELATASREQPVIVVTNDRAIVTDVVAAGANTVASDAFLALTRR